MTDITNNLSAFPSIYDPLLIHAVELTEKWIGVQQTALRLDQLPDVIRTIYGALRDAAGPAADAVPDTPVVKKPTAKQISDSITDEAMISFEDGKPYRSMKRHLTARGLTPAAYREKWGLPQDYPIVHPVYSARRSELAKQNGLGRK